MNLLDLKNKMLDEINLAELNFLYQNSYLNNIFYVGRKFEIEDEKIQYQNLKYIDKDIEIIALNADKFESTMDIKYFNNIIPYLNKLYKSIVNKFDDFINDKNVIKDFVSLYRISIFVVKYLKQFELKNYCYDLWYRPLVRDIHPEILDKNYKWTIRGTNKLILPFAENGMYDVALQAYKTLEGYEFYNEITPFYDLKQGILYYKTDIALKIQNFKLLNDYYCEFLKLKEDNKNAILSLNTLSCLRLAEICLLFYKNQKDEKLLIEFNNSIKRGFDYFNQHPIGLIPPLDKDIDLLKYFHIEYFREPMLELMYYLEI